MTKSAKTASQGTKNEHFLQSHNLLLDSHSLTTFGGVIDWAPIMILENMCPLGGASDLFTFPITVDESVSC